VAITSSLPVSTILRTVWDDLGELSVRLRSQSVIACASAIFFALIGAIPAISDNRMLAEVFDLIGTFVLVPFQIAIYRLLISGDAASGYRFDISTVRFRRMLGVIAGGFETGLPAMMKAGPRRTSAPGADYQRVACTSP
jgi:hypothetical protein